jgi:hypothetical protein
MHSFFKIDTIYGARQNKTRACDACLCHWEYKVCLPTIFLRLFWHPRQYIDPNFEKTVFSFVFGQKPTFQLHIWPKKVKIWIQSILVYFCILQLPFEDRSPKNIGKYWHLWECIVCLLNFFKIDAIHGARRYAERTCSACVTRQFTNIFKIDTFGDALFAY